MILKVRSFIVAPLVLALALPSGQVMASTAIALSPASAPAPASATANVQAPALPLTAAPDVPMTPELVKRAQNLRTGGNAYHTRILGKMSKLSTSVGKGFSQGITLADEAIQLQAVIIMMAMMANEVSTERAELQHLFADREAQPSEAAVAAGPTELCSAKTESVKQKMLCSGDFLLVVTEGALMLPATHGVGALLRWLFKGPTRNATLTVIGGMMLQMTAAVASAQVWDEAVKELPSKEMIEQASGLAGRAGLALLHFNWEQFSASEDGKIFSLIVNNMYKILLVDEDLRDEWMYNTWRFGLARGEVITSMGVIMAASSLGNTTKVATLAASKVAQGAEKALLATALGWSASTLGFVVSTALGIGVMTVVFASAFPKTFTQALQSARQFGNQGLLNIDRGNLKILAYGFHSHSGDQDFQNVYADYINTNIRNLIRRRSYWTNVAVEKFYELEVETNKLRAKVEQAQQIVRQENLKKDIYLQIDGQILSYNQARQNSCARVSARVCDVPVAFELKLIEQYKPVIEQADQTLSQIAQSVVDQYAQDEAQTYSYFVDPSFIFPASVSTLFSDFRRQSEVMRDTFKIIFASLNSGFAAQLGFSEDNISPDMAREELNIYYTHWFDEVAVYKSIRDTLGN